jgi:hypothetical protein
LRSDTRIAAFDAVTRKADVTAAEREINAMRARFQHAAARRHSGRAWRICSACHSSQNRRPHGPPKGL